MEGIYRTLAARREALALYDRALARLPFSVESLIRPTSFGATHLLAAGDPAAPPLVVVHGANGSAVAMAHALGVLRDSHRCFFVDVPGEPNRSAERRLDKRGDEPGRWTGELLGALDLERAALAGMSGGGHIVLKSAASLGDRVTHALLIVPEGLAPPRPWTFATRVLVPLVLYRLRPNDASARRLAAQLAALPISEVGEELVEQMALMTCVKSAAPLGKPLTREELGAISAAVMIVAGGRDAIFPGDAICERARRELATLRDVVFLPEAGHAHPDLFADDVFRRMRAFLAAS